MGELNVLTGGKGSAKGTSGGLLILAVRDRKGSKKEWVEDISGADQGRKGKKGPFQGREGREVGGGRKRDWPFGGKKRGQLKKGFRKWWMNRSTENKERQVQGGKSKKTT